MLNRRQAFTAIAGATVLPAITSPLTSAASLNVAVAPPTWQVPVEWRQHAITWLYLLEDQRKYGFTSLTVSADIHRDGLAVFDCRGNATDKPFWRSWTRADSDFSKFPHKYFVVNWGSMLEGVCSFSQPPGSLSLGEGKTKMLASHLRSCYETLIDRKYSSFQATIHIDVTNPIVSHADVDKHLYEHLTPFAQRRYRDGLL